MGYLKNKLKSLKIGECDKIGIPINLVSIKIYKLKTMKRVLLLLSTLLAIVLWGCNKEGEYPISLLKACEIVKPYIDQYPPGPLLVAKDPIPANKTLKYGLFGNYDPSSPFSGKIKTPNFKSWLIVRQRDASVEGSWDCNHFFVNAKTGEVVEMVLTGYFEDIDWDGHWPYPIPYEEESYEPTPWSTPSTPTKKLEVPIRQMVVMR